MKKNAGWVVIFLSLLVGFTNAQTAQFGKSPKEQKLRSIDGAIGNTIYSTTYKGNDLYINKHFATLDIETSQKIETEEIDLRKFTWEIVKVDEKLVLIIAVSDKDAPTKIYGKTVVSSSGKIVSDEKLKLVGEWENPTLNGKQLFMGKKIKIVSPPEQIGLQTSNNKILLYYLHFSMISATNGNKDNLLNFFLLDKDLNKVDAQSIVFDPKEEYHVESPVTDSEGNFFFIARAYNASSRLDHYLAYTYDHKRKTTETKELSFSKLKKDEKPTKLGNLMINANNNLTFSGFYGNYGEYGVLQANGICIGELNLSGEFGHDFRVIDKTLFAKSFADPNEKTVSSSCNVELASTEHFIIVSKSCTGLTKKGESSGSHFVEYSILKKEDNGKLIAVNSYASPIYNNGIIETVKPSFVEGKDKLFMIMATQKFYCESLSLTKPSPEVCLLNTFNLNGDIQTTFLYNVEQMNPTPKNKYLLKNGGILLWGASNHDFVKIELK